MKLHQKSEVTGKVTVRISSVRAIQAKAHLPGEVAGPGVAITIVVDNASPRPIDLDDVVVTLMDSSDAPGGAMSDARAQPLHGTLAAAGKRTGVYVFTVPTSRRNPVTVTVTLTGASPVVQFTGPVS